MSKLHITTDSGACFSNPRLLQQYPVTTIPYKVQIGTKQYREGVDISAEDVLKYIRSQSTPPKLIAPSVQEFADTFTTLSRVYDGIISIHTSREITESWYNAQRAAQQVSDSIAIAVVDSRTICAGQGMLVRVAGQAALDGAAFEDAVQEVRGAVERIYSAYYVESLEYLQNNQIMSQSHAILGGMLGVKPFVSLEDGAPIITEKVRTRSQAIDRMVEFLVEFETLDDAMIVQNRSHITEQARILQDRLSVEFPGRHFPYTLYGAALAVILGADATGVVVLEHEIEGLDDA